MIIGLLKKLARASVAPRTLFYEACLLAGCVTGMYLWAWQAQFAALLGNSTAVATAISLAMAVGFVVGFIPRTSQIAQRRRWLGAGVLLFGTAIWAWGFPFFIQFTDWAAGRWGTSLAESPASAFAFTSVVALMGLGLPGFAFCRIWSLLAESTPKRSEAAPRVSCAPLVWQLFGLCCGLVLAGSGLGPWLGLQSAAMVAAVIAGVVAVYCLWRAASSEEEAEQSSSDIAPAPSLTGQKYYLSQVCAWGVASLFGLFAANAFRMTGQLYFASGEMVSLSWAAAAIGLSLGCALGVWRLRRDAEPGQLRVFAIALFAVWAVSLTATFPVLIKASLWLNSYESSRLLLTAGRAGISALFFLPLGVAWGLATITVAARLGDNRSTAIISLLGLLPAAVGYCCYRWFQLASLGPAIVVTVLACALWLIVVVEWIATRHAIVGWWRRGILTAGFAAVAISPVWHGQYDPVLAARILFSTDVFLAYRSEFGVEELRQFDDSRLESVIEGELGTYSLWKRRGSQFQIRKNGLTTHVIASDPGIHPQYSAELLPGVVPFILHERPDRVMMLGLGSGVSLAAGLHFPLIEIDCIEADGTYLDFMENEVLPATRDNPLEDDRVVVRHADPALVAVAGGGTYDVILSDPGYGSPATAAPYLTRNYYQHLSKQLADGGIFAQRFRYIDYGPEPLRVASETLRSVFAEVLFLQTAPGEMLLLGTNDPRGLVRENLLERASRPHVQAALADCGWNWTIVLNLSTHNAEQLSELTAGTNSTVNTITNGHFYCTLPREVMRWGQKSQEISAALLPRMGRLLSEMGEDKDDPDVLEHLAEVTGQQKLIRDYPDQYWSYRASLREQVTSGASNRSIIQQIKHELAGHAFHPRDRRRMDYFEALGEAAKSKAAKDIQRVAAFAAPFDTMLSYFLHEEVAELYSRAGDERDPAAELRHRLYATYFSVPGDRSIRNIVDTLTLLLEYPTAEPDPLRRWDQINGLLQLLQTRWYARGAVQPKSFRVMISDVSESLRVIDKTLAAMRDLSTEAGVSEQVWNERERVLKRTLIKPLSDYRQALKPQYEKVKAAGKMAQEQAAQ